MPDLKPCPFCAGKARLELHKFHELGNTYGVKCELCGAQGAQFYNTEQDAIRAWNRRKDNAMKPEVEHSGGGSTWWNVCGACKTAINPNDKYCHECGVSIDWGRNDA